MPAPFKMMHNPNWTADNGEPEWIPYPPRDPNHGGQGRANTMHHTSGLQHHQMPNMPRHPQGPQPRQTPNPARSAPSTQPRPAPYADPASNAGGLVHNGGPYNNMGTLPGNGNLSRTGVPPNYGIPSNTGTNHNISSGSEMPGVPVNTDGYGHGQMPPADAQPSVPQPAAQPQMNAQTGYLDELSITPGPAPTPVDIEARIDALVPEVKRALKSSRKGNPGRIKNLNDLWLNERAVEQSRRRGGPDLCGDMPQDEATQQVYANRIFDAMINIEGIESRETRVNPSKRDKRPVDSVAVKCVKERNGAKFEIVAWKFLRALMQAQKGHLELDEKFNFTVFETFRERFVTLVDCLRINKHLVRSAVESDEWVDRIAADPEGERKQKSDNQIINDSKLAAIREGRQMKDANAGAPGSKKKRSGSTATNTKKRARLSLSDEAAQQDQSQERLEPPEVLQQQHGRQQQHQPQEQYPQVQQIQQPQQQVSNSSQNVIPQQGFGNQVQYAQPQHEAPHQYGHPQHIEQPQQFQQQPTNHPQDVNPQHSVGNQVQYAQPPCDQPRYEPQYEHPQYETPHQHENIQQSGHPEQIGQPQKQPANHPQYVNPQQDLGNQAQYTQPQYTQPQYTQPQYTQPPYNQPPYNQPHHESQGDHLQYETAQQYEQPQQSEHFQPYGHHQQIGHFQQHGHPEQVEHPQQYGYPQQYVGIQQGGHLQQSENFLQAHDRQQPGDLERTEHSQQTGNPPQLEGPQQQGNPLHEQNRGLEEHEASQHLDNAQQHGASQQPGQMPADVPEAGGATAPATDGQQSPQVGDGSTGQAMGSLGELFGEEFEDPNVDNEPITVGDLARLGFSETLTMEDYAALDPQNYSMGYSTQENSGMEGVDVEESPGKPDTQGSPEADPPV